MNAAQRVVVTGASRGIGREIALAFARAGYSVALAARGTAELSALAQQIAAGGGVAHAFPCDVTAPEQVLQLRDAVLEHLGGVEVLVNNAGAAASHKFVDHPDELWHHMLAVNLSSVYYVSKAFVPLMLAQRRGRIINLASTAAKVGARYIAAYTAAKHGVLGLTRALASELVSAGITVNAICPGYVDTPLTEQTIANIVERTSLSAEQARAALEHTSPQQRLIRPQEVAALAVFLAAPESQGITGQAINIDGGAVMY